MKAHISEPYAGEPDRNKAEDLAMTAPAACRREASDVKRASALKRRFSAMLLVPLFVVALIVAFPFGPAAGLWLLGLWPGSLEPLRRARIPLAVGIVALAGALVFVEDAPALLAEVSLIYRNFGNAETPQILSHGIYKVSFAIGYLPFLLFFIGGRSMKIEPPVESGSVNSVSIFSDQKSIVKRVFLRVATVLFTIMIATILWNHYVSQIYSHSTEVGWRGFNLRMRYPSQPIMTVMLGGGNFFLLGGGLIYLAIELKRAFRKLRGLA